MMRIIDVVHALRLCHIDLLGKMPIEKGPFTVEGPTYVKLENAPLTVEGNVKNSTEGDQIYHGIESLVKVNSRLLVKAFRNKASFIPCNKAFRIFLVRNTYLLPTIFYPGLGGTRAQLPFRMRASHSSCITVTYLGSCRA